MFKVPKCPGYFVTKSGKVFSIKQIKPMIHSDGYLRVCLYGQGEKRKRYGIHQLIAFTFLSKPKDGQKEVRHLDGNKYTSSSSPQFHQFFVQVQSFSQTPFDLI